MTYDEKTSTHSQVPIIIPFYKWGRLGRASIRASERKGKSREEHIDLSYLSVSEEKRANGGEETPFLSHTLMLARPNLPHFNSSFLDLQEALARNVDIFI